MHALDRCDRGRLGQQWYQRLRYTGEPASGDDGSESGGTLGVIVSGDVLEIRRMGGEQHGHETTLGNPVHERTSGIERPVSGWLWPRSRRSATVSV